MTRVMHPEKKSRKLDLARETLAPLQPDQLDAVNGGEGFSIGVSRNSISWSANDYSFSVSRTNSVSASRSNASVSVSGG